MMSRLHQPNKLQSTLLATTFELIVNPRGLKDVNKLFGFYSAFSHTTPSTAVLPVRRMRIYATSARNRGTSHHISISSESDEERTRFLAIPNVSGVFYRQFYTSCHSTWSIQPKPEVTVFPWPFILLIIKGVYYDDSLSTPGPSFWRMSRPRWKSRCKLKSATWNANSLLSANILARSLMCSLSMRISGMSSRNSRL